MEALLLPRNWVIGTATFTQQPPMQDPIKFLNEPEWKEPAADPLLDSLRAAGDAASLVSEPAKSAARAVLNLVSPFAAPEIGVEGVEITLEWYKDRDHVVVVSLDGTSIRWAAVVGLAEPMKGKEPFDNELPQDVLNAIRAVA